MVTVLDKDLKRQVTVDGAEYTVTLTRDGFRLTAKGRRRAEVELRWLDLLSGDAAMAVALNASLAQRSKPATQAPTADGGSQRPRKGARKARSGQQRRS